MTCIVVCPSELSNVALTLGHLSVQTVAKELEVMVCCTRPMEVPGKLVESFAAFRILLLDGPPRRGPMAAAGVREASSPFVVCVENHVFPESDWAEKLLEGHRSTSAGVSPRVLLYNDDTPIARACHHLDFGHLEAQEPVFVDWTPWHNTSYRVDLLLSFGPELGELLDLESALQARLREQGHHLLLYPDATIQHTANSTWRTALGTYFSHGRCFAASRSAAWTSWRRVLYATASPLFPLLIMRAVWPKFEHLDARTRAVHFPYVLAFAVARAIGEAVGFLGGSGDAWEFVVRHEFFLELRVTQSERDEMERLAESYLNSLRASP